MLFCGFFFVCFSTAVFWVGVTRGTIRACRRARELLRLNRDANHRRGLPSSGGQASAVSPGLPPLPFERPAGAQGTWQVVTGRRAAPITARRGSRSTRSRITIIYYRREGNSTTISLFVCAYLRTYTFMLSPPLTVCTSAHTRKRCD